MQNQLHSPESQNSQNKISKPTKFCQATFKKLQPWIPALRPCLPAFEIPFQTFDERQSRSCCPEPASQNQRPEIGETTIEYKIEGYAYLGIQKP